MANLGSSVEVLPGENSGAQRQFDEQGPVDVIVADGHIAEVELPAIRYRKL